MPIIKNILIATGIIVASVALLSVLTYARRAEATTLPVMANLSMWLDASQLTGYTNGQGVATWPDESGNGYDAIAGAADPTYVANDLNGHPGLRFVSGITLGTGVSEVMRAHPTTCTLPYTLFVVAKMNDTSIGGGVTGRVLGSIYPDDENYLLGWWNGFERVMYGEGFVTPGTTPSSTNWHEYDADGTGTNTAWYDFGTLIDSNGNGNAGPNGAIAISGYGSFAGGDVENETSDFDMVEVICYSAALDDADRESVENYLYNKYFVAPTNAPELGVLSGRLNVLSGSLKAL